MSLIEPTTGRDIVRGYIEVRERLRGLPKASTFGKRSPADLIARQYANRHPIAIQKVTAEITATLFTPVFKEPLPVDNARRIVRDVAARHGIPPGDIYGEKRSREVVDARFEAIHLVDKATNWSLPRLGRFFGDRDHSSIHHALKTYRARVIDQDQIKKQARDLELVEQIIVEVAGRHSITTERLMSREKSERVLNARTVAVATIYDRTGWTRARIARRLGVSESVVGDALTRYRRLKSLRDD